MNSSTCTSEGSLLEETMKNTTGENLQVNPMMIECFVFTNLQISQESIKHFVLHPSVCELNDPNFLYSQSQTLTSKWAPDKGFPLRRFTEIHPEVGTKSLDHHPTPSRLLETQSTINKRRSWFFLGVQLGLLCTSAINTRWSWLFWAQFDLGQSCQLTVEDL